MVLSPFYRGLMMMMVLFLGAAANLRKFFVSSFEGSTVEVGSVAR